MEKLDFSEREQDTSIQ